MDRLDRVFIDANNIPCILRGIGIDFVMIEKHGVYKSIPRDVFDQCYREMEEANEKDTCMV